MHVNEKLVHDFYSAFQQKDYKTMQACYDEGATFSDPVFQNLNASQVRSMWEMFCVRSKSLDIQFKDISADDNTGSAIWTATYVFSATKKTVINTIKANFMFENGKIVKHKDDFNFYHWAKQAFGAAGYLLGWTPFLKNKVRKMAKKNLLGYMKQ